MLNRIYILLSICGIFYSFGIQAQNQSLLETEINLKLNAVSVDNVLSQMAQQGKFAFSYNAALLEGLTPITADFNAMTVRQILNQIFGADIKVQENKQYIILTKLPPKPAPLPNAESSVFVNGYILNLDNNQKVQEVSIFSKDNYAAAVSNNYGYFALNLDKAKSKNQISISKKGYYDTTLLVGNQASYFLTVLLRPEKTNANPGENTIDSRIIEQEPLLQEEENTYIFTDRYSAFESNENEEYNENTAEFEDEPYPPHFFDDEDDSRHSLMAISLFPYISTNGIYSDRTVNDYSFNLIGYSAGTNVLELAAWINIDRGPVKGVQGAGWFNLNSSTMTGLQGAGFMNINGGNVNALQGAGLMNINAQSMHGIQGAGIMNINGGSGDGLMAAGMANIQQGNYKGLQAAGLFNISERKMDGLQVAGLFNYGKNVKGSQLAFMNFADSVSGVSIGFLSFVKHGYHQLEFSADEIFYTNMALRTGTHKFYNIFNFGLKPDNINVPYWTIGYGIGTAPRLARWLHLNFDFTANHVNQGDFSSKLNLLNKAYAGIELKPARKLGLAFGITYNVYLRESEFLDLYPPLFTEYQPPIINQRKDDDVQLQIWWGAKAAIRFF